MEWSTVPKTAMEIAQELELDYYTSVPTRLNLTESLYLISRKVELGPKPPESLFTDGTPPWSISAKATPKSELINDLLNYSIRVQSGTFQKVTELKDYVMSRNPRIISGLMYRYLKYLNVDVKMIPGILTFSPAANADGTPYTWLNIHDKLIDNSFIHVPGNGSLFFKMRDARLYITEDPQETDRQLFMDNTSESHPDLKSYHVFSSNDEHLEKLLVFILKANPRAKLYDILMKHYLKTKYEITMENMESNYIDVCWKCKVKSNDLKACQGCQISQYCSKFCQKNDWNVHKLLHIEASHYQANEKNNQ